MNSLTHNNNKFKIRNDSKSNISSINTKIGKQNTNNINKFNNNSRDVSTERNIKTKVNNKLASSKIKFNLAHAF